MIIPTLRTERLILSEIVSTDANAVFNLFSNKDVIKYYDLEAFEEESQAEKLINAFRFRFESEQGIRWGIREENNSKLIGTCGFNSWNIHAKSATIGYDLLPQYWGRGIAKEAIEAILRIAFSGLLPCREIHRIQADTVPGNDASERLLSALGFKEEGLRRESGYWKNQFHDLKCFGLLKHEFQ